MNNREQSTENSRRQEQPQRKDDCRLMGSQQQQGYQNAERNERKDEKQSRRPTD